MDGLEEYGLMGCSPISRQKCWTFAVIVVVSIVALGIGIAGLSGAFSANVSTDFYTGLISFVVGIWVHSPKLSSNKRAKKPKRRRLMINEDSYSDDSLETISIGTPP